MGAGLGWIMYLFSTRKGEVSSRISECLKVPASEARKIQRRMYRNLGYTAGEFFRMPYMSPEEVKGLIRYENVESLPEDGKGSIFLVGHTGNWELMAAGTAFLDPPHSMHMVVKFIKPASLNAWIEKTRAIWGNTVVDRRGSSKELLRALKNGANLAFILDQNAKRNWGIFVEFFGKPACTSHGLAQMAALSGHRIFPAMCRRDPETRNLVVEIGEEVPGPKDRSEEEVLRVTQECTDRLEAFIRAYPDQWIWMHRRWKTQKI